MLTTTVEHLEGITVKLTVTVPADLVDAAIARTYKTAAKKVRIPGFRPGKAPRQVLDNMMGHEYLMAEATEDVVNSTYSLALDQEQLRPIESPELSELDKVEAGTDFTYFVEIEIRPELTLSSTDGLTVAVPPAEASEADIDAHIEINRERFATLEPVEGRGVEADDFVLVSFVGLVDGEPYEGNEVDKYLYEMGRGLMPAEFDAGLLGIEPGGQTQVEFEIPDTSSNPDFAGKKATFDITVHEIKAKVLPEVNDEFASNVGGFDTVADLRADLKKRLDVQKVLAHDRAKEHKVREAIAERLEGDIPEAMVVQRQASMTRDFISMIEEQQMTIDQYLAGAGVDMDTFEADMKEQATLSVRQDLALEALFTEKGLEVTDEDLDAEFEEIAKAMKSTVDEARAKWKELGMNVVLNEQITHRKAMQWLLDNVQVTVEPEESTEE